MTGEDRWIELLRDLVDVDSGPDASDGVTRVLDRLAVELEALGFVNRRQPAPPGPDTLIAERAGTRAATRVLLLGHADTVFGVGTAAKRPFTIHADGRATGPGVADMKAGLVVMLAGLAALSDEARERLHLRVIVNGDEESGSADSRSIFEEAAAAADIALVFEPGRPPGMVVQARRGAQRYRIHVRGRAAHTGVNPEDGANAIETVAHHVLALQELGRRTAGASVTAVLVSGGARPNIVPDTAWLHIDTRFDDAATETVLSEAILALQGPGPVEGTTTQVEVLDQRPAFVSAGRSTAVVAAFAAAAEELGVPFGTTNTGGSSDGNFVASLGVPTLDGLGAVGAGFHTEAEYVELDTVRGRAALFVRALERLSRGHLQGEGTRSSPPGGPTDRGVG